MRPNNLAWPLMNVCDHAQAVTGIKVEVTHSEGRRRCYRVSGMASVPADEDFFQHEEMGRVSLFELQHAGTPLRTAGKSVPADSLPLHLRYVVRSPVPDLHCRLFQEPLWEDPAVSQAPRAQGRLKGVRLRHCCSTSSSAILLP